MQHDYNYSDWQDDTGYSNSDTGNPKKNPEEPFSASGKTADKIPTTNAYTEKTTNS